MLSTARLTRITIEKLPLSPRRENTMLQEIIRLATRRIFIARLNKRPVVEVHLVRI